jgi:hypothetical protein
VYDAVLPSIQDWFSEKLDSNVAGCYVSDQESDNLKRNE